MHNLQRYETITNKKIFECQIMTPYQAFTKNILPTSHKKYNKFCKTSASLISCLVQIDLSNKGLCNRIRRSGKWRSIVNESARPISRGEAGRIDSSLERASIHDAQPRNQACTCQPNRINKYIPTAFLIRQYNL